MMRSLCAAMLLLLLFAATPAHAVTLSGLGFSFELPDDWRAIPRAEIERALEGGKGTARNPAALMAFEPESHKSPFSFPYVTIRSIENEDKGTFETLTEAQIKARLAKLAALPEERFEKLATTEPATRPDRVPRYSLSPPYYVVDSWERIGEYDVHKRQMGFLGRNYGVIATFAAKEADFPEQSPIADNIIATLRFAPSQSAALATPFWEAHGTQTIMGILFLCLLGYSGYRLIRWFTTEPERPM
jgi:hypothetical protein